MITTAPKNLKIIKKIPSQIIFKKGEQQIIFTEEIQNSKIILEENAKITFICFLTKGWKEKKHLTFHLKGKHAQVNFFAIIIGKDKNNFPLETISLHTSPQTNAFYHVRTALFDSSRIDYIGNIQIKENAQQVNSYLAHHTLMLSPNASVHTIPCLEIEADDVKAGHAATIGQIEEDQLFYLLSRGINRKTAENLLIKSFFKKEIGKISDKAIRCYICEKIDQEIELQVWETYGINCQEYV